MYPREPSSEAARGKEGETLTKVTRSHKEGFVDPGAFLRASEVGRTMASSRMSTC